MTNLTGASGLRGQGQAAHEGPLRILHVLTSTAPASGGPSYTVPALASALGDTPGTEVALAALSDCSGNLQPGMRRIAASAAWAPRPLRRMAFSPKLRRAIAREWPSVVHTHGLWQMPPLYGAWAAFKRGVPLVIAPRGMLSTVALGFSPGAKRIFGALLQNRVLHRANAFHVTAESEYEDIRAFGLEQPVAIVPNGVDLPDLSLRTKRPRRTILSLGRVHPKKGLDTLILAWKRIASRFPDWNLRIVGPDEGGHSAELEALATSIGSPRTKIMGPVYGDRKWAEFHNAGLFVLPTRNENFAVTVAEALSVEVPVISSKGAPWSGLAENRCGWWIDYGVEPLASALTNALRLNDAARREMGRRGRAWVRQDFSWERIARDMHEVYMWLRVDGAKPNHVKTE